MSLPVIAQEYQDCFLVNNNGQYINLREFCPDQPIEKSEPVSNEENSETPPPPPSSSPENETPITPSNPDSPRTFPTLPNSDDNQLQSNNSAFFTVPIHKKLGGIPLIHVKFNGDQTFEMLLDTGATITTVTPEMEQQLNLQAEQVVPVATAGGIIQSSISKVDSIQVGDLTINNLLVSSSPALTLGLLGQNFYNNYDILIKENTIEFHPRNTPKN